ncbi:MAG: YeeE/YedE family protein [Bdellovibrio sp.]|nr:MAG: YeeE/YedE family protein [Bdellovibrio sp.]
MNIQMSLFGGVLIGLAAAGMLFFHGKILGVSGIVGGLLNDRSRNMYWRLTFLLGLLLGALLLEPLGFSVMHETTGISLIYIGVGGFLVGLGAALGNGCTSGHGVCGISRLSPRSIIATVSFMITGFLSVTVLHTLLNGGQ